jgi:hypothetical protein
MRKIYLPPFEAIVKEAVGYEIVTAEMVFSSPIVLNAH